VPQTAYDLEPVLRAVARTTAACLGYGTAVINLYRPAWDDFHTVVVEGSDEARRLLLGQTSTAERIRAAGVLHDIGKLGVADAVLQKPGPLTDDEWADMRRHPELGARILDHANLRDISAWVLAHHERVDGGGYPLGLAGEQIPLEARILAVGDAYEAMTADRPYRAALGHDAARDQLRACVGTQFDPRVVEAFLDVLAPASRTRETGLRAQAV
jgi:HD-GYP domain-containing protein (c-di-GMP phosphodiesterase class II)